VIPHALDIAEGVSLLRVLANPARLRIALHLLDGERSVGQIEGELEIKQPNLSQHLAELRDAGLLVSRRESRAVFYRVAPGRPQHLVSSLLHGLGGTAPASAPTVRRPHHRTAAAATFAVIRGAQ
jgi:DNA-binding transcriptional ArsR family regulator